MLVGSPEGAAETTPDMLRTVFPDVRMISRPSERARGCADRVVGYDSRYCSKTLLLGSKPKKPSQLSNPVSSSPP